jgi:hypothetical protein
MVSHAPSVPTSIMSKTENVLQSALGTVKVRVEFLMHAQNVSQIFIWKIIDVSELSIAKRPWTTRKSVLFVIRFFTRLMGSARK